MMGFQTRSLESSAQVLHSSSSSRRWISTTATTKPTNHTSSLLSSHSHLVVQFVKVLIVQSCLLLIFSSSTCNIRHVVALDTSSCPNPLGMESFDIQDTDVTASSSFDAGNVGPQNARVRVERQGGAWCPKNQVTSEAEEWIQIDLHTVHVITATETQGRFGNGQGQEYTEKYILSYWRPELGKWVRYRDSTGNEILKANINTYLSVKTELTPPILASKIRFLPYSLHRRTVCMRVEIYGCPFRDGLISYTMNQGSKRGDSWNFYDHTYDGLWEGNVLRNGLGLLVDGRGGPDNFKDDYYGHERGKGWVGWKNDTKNGNQPVEMVFKFDGVREFTAVHIHSSNQFTKDIQVFSEARVHFSIGGTIFPGDPISYVTMEDCIFEDPKNVTIKLHHRIGQYIRIQLFWAAKWIMISEVTFDSQPAIGNFTDEETIAGIATVVPATATISPLDPQTQLIQPGDAEAAGPGTVLVEDQQQQQSDSSSAGSPDKHHQQRSHHHHESSSRSGSGDSPASHHHQHATSTVHHKNAGAVTVTASEWSTATIVMTAVISSFVAILMVLLFILTALVLRNKLNPGVHGLGLGLNNCNGIGGGMTGLEYGPGCYITPQEIRKCKISTTLGSNGSAASGGNGTVEYQEPFIASGTAPFPGANQTIVAATMKGRMVEYYSCSVVPNNSVNGQLQTVSSTTGGILNNLDMGNEYEYAVPNELGKLLPPPSAPAAPSAVNQLSPQHKASTVSLSIPNSPAIATRTRAIQLKFRELGIAEIPKHRLRMLRKLGDGAFGTVFIGEIEMQNEKNLVAVKHLLRNATEKDKADFLEEIRLLASLNDPNVAQVLGVCTEEEPYSVVLEFLELGDLCQFLRQNDTLLATAKKKLSATSLVYLASQIASGMRFLEGRNIVHRDLATRNCVVGHGLVVKISHFATDTDLYASDYYRLDGKMPLPIRWMAWESLFLGKYSTKSDVWSFGVTLWEILSYSRHSPYPTMTNQEVLSNLRKLSIPSDLDPFEPLSKPNGCPRDIYQLICDTWRRNDDERPSFWEIHSFLARKCMNFTTTMGSNATKTLTLNNNNTQRVPVPVAPAPPPSFPSSLPSSTSTSTTTTTASEQYVI